MRYSSLCAAFVVIVVVALLLVGATPARGQLLLYSFETALPSGAAPDGFSPNGPGTILQSQIGATDPTVGPPSHSMKWAVPGPGATFVGALTTNVIPGTTGPLVQGYSFDLTINPGETFTGAFANIGVTLFEVGGIPHQSDQFFAIPANTSGTFHVVLTGLTDANNGHVPLIPEFAPGGTAVQSGFQLWLNKTADPITLYVDNIRTVVPEPASPLSGCGAAAMMLLARRRQKA
jgi:hypothetical protein